MYGYILYIVIYNKEKKISAFRKMKCKDQGKLKDGELTSGRRNQRENCRCVYGCVYMCVFAHL